jgi:LPXTG-motif cell wall-anchored protein
LKELLKDWHNWLPLLGVVVLALVGVIFWLRRKPEDADEIERKRCAFLNRVGRIVEGQILEIVEHSRDSQEARPSSILEKRKSATVAAANGTRKLLYYTYSISGVTYETAQDVTGLEERLHVTRIATGQTASVKYDPSNPSNSILLADDWSGLH